MGASSLTANSYHLSGFRKTTPGFKRRAGKAYEGEASGFAVESDTKNLASLQNEATRADSERVSC